jgi:hypothetical protein
MRLLSISCYDVVLRSVRAFVASWLVFSLLAAWPGGVYHRALTPPKKADVFGRIPVPTAGTKSTRTQE